MFRALESKHPLAADATRALRRHTNVRYAPVLTTEELASHIGSDVSTAADALKTAHTEGYIHRKRVGTDGEDPIHVWWE